MALGLVLLGCNLKEAQVQSCYAQADSAKIAEARSICKGHTWAECPFREEIRKKHREALRKCSE